MALKERETEGKRKEKNLSPTVPGERETHS